MKSINFALLIMPVASMINLQAQDYLISFGGTGARTSVDSVKIENLTQGTKLKMKGSDILHLMGTTGIESISDNETGKISFYPNPMKDNARMQFVLPVNGETQITFYDITGKIIAQTRDFLSTGKHTYGIQGIKEGIYIIRITTGKYSCAGRLISSGSQTTGTKIIYENTIALQEKQSDSKGTNEEEVMQYTIGDRLKMIGISGVYSTVITDVPTEGKSITFNFIACTDGDGKNYPVVQIGTAKGTTGNPSQTGEKAVQIWMAENLKTNKYNNGITIPFVNNDVVWSNLTTPGYCWYNNDNVTYEKSYGALYNWHTINAGNLCPIGWHVPSDIEWTILTLNLGGESIAGGKLKETGTAHWVSTSAGTTNETGFTALPGGWHHSNGSFGGINERGVWWSSTEFSSQNVWARSLNYTVSYVSRYYVDKRSGFSVRCLKD